jgi:hypothetical protein
MKAIKELCDLVRKYVMSRDPTRETPKAPGVFLFCSFEFFCG